MTREVSERAAVPEQRGGSHTEARPASPEQETEQLRADILRTRTELGETVEALTAKADIKARAQQEGRRIMDRARSAPGSASGRQRAAAAAFLGGIAAGAVVVIVLRRRRTHASAADMAATRRSSSRMVNLYGAAPRTVERVRAAAPRTVERVRAAAPRGAERMRAAAPRGMERVRTAATRMTRTE